METNVVEYRQGGAECIKVYRIGHNVAQEFIMKNRNLVVHILYDGTL